MNATSALKSYSNNKWTSEVQGESPEKLIYLLLQKGCELLLRAEHCLKQDDLNDFHNSTTHCMQILVALRGLLDFENGEEVATQLAETYDAINSALFRAKREKSTGDIRKLYEALSELREGWASIS